MTKAKNPHWGSSLDEFLDEEGTREAFQVIAEHERAMKIQRMSDLEAEMRKVARGEITAPPDAALPSVDSTEALDRNQSGIVSL